MVKLSFGEERVPLREVAEGDVRVGDTKVALEGVISAYRQGYTPEQIQDDYDVISLGDVYSIIGYYLRRKEEVDQYMQECDESWDRFAEDLESQPGAREFYDRVRKARRQKEMGQQAAKGLE